MYLVKTPAIIKKMYSNLVWDYSHDDKSIYLTFDDGPIPEITPWVLDLLAKYRIKATFFCIGNNVKKHPKIFERVLYEGHRVGNHTFNHSSGWTVNDDFYLDDVSAAKEYIDSNIFRPPYGRLKRSQIRVLEEQYKIIMWDVISGDFDKKFTAEDCYKNVIQNARDGSIVVFHDSVKAKERLQGSLERVIEHLSNQGYNFKLIE